MHKESKILVLGNFGYKTRQLDGQTVKTRNVFSLFNEKLPGQVTYFDTASLKYNKYQFFRMVWMAILKKKIVYLPAHNNLKYLFPLLYIMSRTFNTDIYYFVIGGWLPEFIKEKRIHRKWLKRLPAIFCETRKLIAKLESWYGFGNVYLIPNFRLHSFEPEIKLHYGTLRLVFMSRIMQAKGVDAILYFADYVNDHKCNEKFIIDFYGPTNEYEGEDFERDISNYSFISYKGIIQPKDIHKTLSLYDCMLFPTRYTGEGFPGAIMDAYIAGIPVIASNKSCNSEFVEHGETGFIFDLDKEFEFHNYIFKIEQDRNLLAKLKHNAAQKGKEYSSESAWRIIEQSLFIK